MLNQDRPKVGVIAIGSNDDSSPANGVARQTHFQRAAVVLMGCLWFMAFAAGCGRNTKNCSAYDGVQLELNVQVEP